MEPPERCWSSRGTALALSLLLALLTLVFLSQALRPPSGQALGSADIRGLFIPWLTYAREAIHGGQLPLWDPYHFGGYPFLANPQVGVFYPPAWLAFLLPVNIAISWYVALHVVVAGVGLLLFVRYVGGRWSGALLAAVSFAFSGFVAARIFAGHIGLLATDAWLPWLLLAFTWAVRRRSARAGVLAGVPFGLAILAGHTTSLLYVGLIWLLFALYLLLTAPSRRPVLQQLLLAGVVGVALSAVQLLPLLQFSGTSARAAGASYQFATNFSFPPAHLITLLIPEYFGEPMRAGYWSVPVFEELIYYVGIIPLLGIVLALRKGGRLVWFYIALAVFGILVALGSYGFLYRLLFEWVPPFRLARAPARGAFLFTFAAAALLGEALSRWQDQPDPDSLSRLLRWSVGLLLVAGLAALAVTGALFAAQHPTDTSGRLWHQVGGWGWMLFVVLLGGALLWWLLSVRPAGRRQWWLTGSLLLLVVADLWLFGFKLIRLESTAPTALWPDARAIIGSTEERVLPWGLSIFEQNGAGQVGLRSIFGYNALEPGRTIALTGSVPDPRSTAYDLFSVGYVIAESPQDSFTEGEDGLELVAQEGAAWVYRRARVMPVVRLVEAVELIAEEAAAIDRIHQPDFDPATTAIVPVAPACTIEAGGNAELLAHDNTLWRVRTESAAPSLLVVSENAYPGWEVTVDGQPAEPVVAYTTLRAVCVPAGEHIVEWRFSPDVFWFGGALSATALLLVVLAIVGPRLQSANRRRQDER